MCIDATQRKSLSQFDIYIYIDQIAKKSVYEQSKTNVWKKGSLG